MQSLLLRRKYYYSKNSVFGFRKQADFKNNPETLISNPNLLLLAQEYRSNAHLYADLNPLEKHSKKLPNSFSPSHYNLNDTDYVDNSLVFGIPSKSSIKSIVDHLHDVYSGQIAYEFQHTNEKIWFANKVESLKISLSNQERIEEMNLLSKSEVFDHFMAAKFPQVKRYGLEGAESMISALSRLFKSSSERGIHDIVLCMPHRGRLNLLAGLLKFSPSRLFHKIKGNQEFPDDTPGIGDVLSHLGTSVELNYENSSVNVSLIHNPSHLEAVNPVAMGKTRAKQMDAMPFEDIDGSSFEKSLCVQLHGDAAFAGQGVVTETLSLSNLPHYTVGGSIHIIVNNQIGYTTPSLLARSTRYASDAAKMIDAPVIHVNGDNPENVVKAVEIALDYRHTFKKDIVIDLIAFRKWGHNEMDEPGFTQPVQYSKIRSRSSIPVLYEETLLKENVIDKETIEKTRSEYTKLLTEELEASYSLIPELYSCKGKWSAMKIPSTIEKISDSGFDTESLTEICEKSVSTPESFNLHPRLTKYFIEPRLRSKESSKFDWATAETMCFGSLMKQGFNIRLSGQDVGRGTFSQRHCMLVDQKSGITFEPLNNMGYNNQGFIEIANSHLSEFAVLGFEVGVSWENPNRLCIWEAQFGDFFNGAQVIIDTFLSNGEAKWFRQSGLVLLLPHGYDGAGPEHSSCRIERFLQLCDQKMDLSSNQVSNPNMHVCYPTTPAQFFHVLRRQMLRSYRKPLILVGPKTLLRNPLAVSDMQEFAPGTSFKPVLDDPSISDSSFVEKVILMSGKLYYELIKKRSDLKLDGKVAIIRIEEFSPFPVAELQQVLQKYSNVLDFRYVQEEPENQGAFTFLKPRIDQLLPGDCLLSYVGRESLCAPAVGVSTRHKKEQEKLITDAFK